MEEKIKNGQGTEFSAKAVDSNKSTKNIKVDTLWYFISEYLDMINYTCAKCDEEFLYYYDQLVNYVNSKIGLSKDNEVIDFYLIYLIK